MTRTRPSPKDDNEILTYDIMRDCNYKLVFSNNPHVDYFVNSINYPDVTCSQVDAPFRNYALNQPGNTVIYSPLTITFLVDEKMQFTAFLERFLKNPANNEINDENDRPFGNSEMNEYRVDLEVHMLNNNSQPNVVIRYEGILCTYVGDIQYSNQNSSPMPITQTASFVFQNRDFA